MQARVPDVTRIVGLALPSRPRAIAVFGLALFFEVLMMVARSLSGWHPTPLNSEPVMLFLDALIAAALVELSLRGALQGALPYFGIGAALSLGVPAALEYFGGYTTGEVLWEAAFGVGFVFARAASGSIYPCIALRFVQYLMIPAFAAVHR